MMACDGCGEDFPVRRYVITYRDGKSERVCYCDECADLARRGWHDNTASIVPDRSQECA